MTSTLRRARLIAVLRPIPRLAPVMMATLSIVVSIDSSFAYPPLLLRIVLRASVAPILTDRGEPRLVAALPHDSARSASRDPVDGRLASRSDGWKYASCFVDKSDE